MSENELLASIPTARPSVGSGVSPPTDPPSAWRIRWPGRPWPASRPCLPNTVPQVWTRS